MDKLNKATQPGSGDKYSYMALKITLLSTIQIDVPFLLGLLLLFFDSVASDALFLKIYKQ